MSSFACSQCGVAAKPGKKFCGKCGGKVESIESASEASEANLESSPTSASPTGGNQIHLDAGAINLILSKFVSKSDGPQVSFEGGRIQAQSGDTAFHLKGVSIQNTEVQVKKSGRGVDLMVEKLELNADGLGLRFRVDGL